MENENNSRNRNDIGFNGGSSNREEYEETLVALITHQTREVKRSRFFLEDAEKKLRESKSKLARLRGQSQNNTSSLDVGTRTLKTEHASHGPIHKNEGSSKNLHQSKPQYPTPALSTEIPQSKLLLCSRSSAKTLISPSSQANPSAFTRSIAGSGVKSAKIRGPPTEQENIEIKVQGTKRKFEQKDHKELIPLIRKSSSPDLVNRETSKYISSQHKKRLRSVALCPVNDQLFVTSALDGVVNLWEVQSWGSGASLLSTTDCLSRQRRWPEDIAWHPDGNSLLSVYSADGQDSQISVTNLSRVLGGARANVNFLEDKPHVKGVINSIVFLPWGNTRFVTGGTDHAVILWCDNGENKWKPKPLHRNLHSNAVMGVAGMQQYQIVLSGGKDKRIWGYNAHVGKQDFNHQLDSKCLSILPNPCDFNLFMAQTGTPGMQLRLFDIRLKQKELHAFGWNQESSEWQSALINQAWSPNGLHITSGSADPMIHIFDIRYNGVKPSQSIGAHKERVFRALWLKSVPLLISIAADRKIGFFKVA